MNAGNSMRMPLLDTAFYLLDGDRSPQDFSLIFHFSNPPDVERFYAGAKSAMNHFPASASVVEGKKWRWRENKYFKLKLVSAENDAESTSATERFIDERFDLRHQPPVRQMLILNGSNRARLVTRFHHAAVDGLSAALWLSHQLKVAYGFEAATHERAAFTGPTLRRLATSVRRSEFAFDGASDRLWTRQSKRSGARRWFTITFPACDLRRACKRAGGFTYNDLLATCALEVFAQWNRRHEKNGDSKIGLWLPVNVRREANAGFGNGTSRIRLYTRYKPDAMVAEKCRAIRRQVSWTSKHGEWVVPEAPWLTHLPRPVVRPLLRGYLNLPSVDMATGVFSHAASWIAGAAEAFKNVERIECVGLLHSRQNLAINGTTHRGQTSLSFTYDPESLTTADVDQITQMYRQQIAVAQDELL